MIIIIEGLRAMQSGLTHKTVIYPGLHHKKVVLGAGKNVEIKNIPYFIVGYIQF